MKTILCLITLCLVGCQAGDDTHRKFLMVQKAYPGSAIIEDPNAVAFTGFFVRTPNGQVLRVRVIDSIPMRVDGIWEIFPAK